MDRVQQVEGGQGAEVAVGVAAQHAVVEAEHVEADHEVRRGEPREQRVDVGLAEACGSAARALSQVTASASRIRCALCQPPTSSALALRLEVEDHDARRGLGARGAGRAAPPRAARAARLGAAARACGRRAAGRARRARPPCRSGDCRSRSAASGRSPGSRPRRRTRASRSRVASSSASMRSNRPAARPSAARVAVVEEDRRAPELAGDGGR